MNAHLGFVLYRQNDSYFCLNLLTNRTNRLFFFSKEMLQIRRVNRMYSIKYILLHSYICYITNLYVHYAVLSHITSFCLMESNEWCCGVNWKLHTIIHTFTAAQGQWTLLSDVTYISLCDWCLSTHSEKNWKKFCGM